MFGTTPLGSYCSYSHMIGQSSFLLVLCNSNGFISLYTLGHHPEECEKDCPYQVVLKIQLNLSHREYCFIKAGKNRE